MPAAHPQGAQHDRTGSAVHDDPDAEGTGGCRERPYRATHYRRDRQRQPVRAAGRQPDRRRQRRLAHQDPQRARASDVRIAIRTTDDAVVRMRYSGRVQLVPGKASSALIAPVFETGDPRYSWINGIQAAGKGVLSADRARLDYEIYELQ